MDAEVLTVIRSVKDYNHLEVDEHTQLIDDLGFTSLDVMNLILSLEQRFNITFQDDDLDLDRFITVGAVRNTLNNYNLATT
jgi:acyl carrier protein